MKESIIGYGWRLSSETPGEAFSQNYGLQFLNKTLKDAKEDFKSQVISGNISKLVKPIYFKLTAQDLKNGK